MDFRGLIWKRLSIIFCIFMVWQKWGQDLKNQAAHPHQEFPGVPSPPPPPSSGAWRKASWKEKRSGFKNLFLSNHFWEKYPKISKIAWRKRLPCRYWEKVPLWSKIRRQENSSLTVKQLRPYKKNYLPLHKVNNTTQRNLAKRKY